MRLRAIETEINAAHAGSGKTLLFFIYFLFKNCEIRITDCKKTTFVEGGKCFCLLQKLFLTSLPRSSQSATVIPDVYSLTAHAYRPRERHRIQNEATVWPVILSAVYYATWGNNAGRPAGWPSGRCVRVCRLIADVQRYIFRDLRLPRSSLYLCGPTSKSPPPRVPSFSHSLLFSV